jgi:hypothetical protein
MDYRRGWLNWTSPGDAIQHLATTLSRIAAWDVFKIG